MHILLSATLLLSLLPTLNIQPPSRSPVQQAGDNQKTVTATPDLRTAYSTTAVSDIGLLTGTQPMVPAGSFESRWSPLR